MSVFDTFFRALGFGGGDDSSDDDILYEGAVPATESKPSGMLATKHEDHRPETDQPDTATKSDNETEPRPTAQPERDEAQSEVNAKALFDGVVEALNRDLPPYLRQCLDNEEQCKFIYASLDEKLQAYIASLAKREATRASSRWGNEKKKLCKQANEAAQQVAQANERAAKAEEKALSSDRQKRAMTQRNADLERRVAKLQAEIEQYDLEKNSLLNKLRVAEVHANQSHGEAGEAQAPRDEELVKELEAMKAENARLNAQLEEANKSLEVVGEIQQQLQGIEEMKNRKNSRIKELKGENERLKAELEELRQSKQEDTEPIVVSVATEPEAEVTMPADAELQSEPEVDVIDMTADPGTGYEPDPTGVTAVIADDMDLLAAITENDALAADEPSQPKAQRKKRKPRARKPKLIAIDDTISESEWLMSSPPVNSEQGKQQAGFGYQEPPHRITPPDNPAQMSLW